MSLVTVDLVLLKAKLKEKLQESQEKEFSVLIPKPEGMHTARWEKKIIKITRGLEKTGVRVRRLTTN